ncbi:hypothetical protein HNR19_001955 [Nocardioides thalensis]|uniref:Type IV toxin-antitoxin system AbiEi family antitoxin domain-containing protein n=1 Tax=Nocardioides thalensis TaxID=1914755 RepID=A0A853C267_9ACTN|nr:hypothetical protein [Nocardioides thalensis]NYJ01257.1 hypothetical protein [Nocardioides thalensis]
MTRQPHFEGIAFLDDSSNLPLDRPFTAATARIEAGLGYRQLKRLVDDGLLQHPIRGVYLVAQIGDTIETRCACLRLVVPEDAVVVDRHAGWLHGAEMVLAPGEHLALRPTAVFRPSGHGRVRNQLSDSGERNLRPGDVVEINGVRVSTAIRTAWDLGRSRWPDSSLAAIDQLLRLGAFSKDEFLAGIERFRGMRWVTTLRAVAPYADGRAESPPESILRLRWIEAHLPEPCPQYEVWVDGEFLARLDIGNAELQFGAEYDGAEWHDTPEQLEHDRRRRTDVSERGNWHVVALRKENLFGQRQNAQEILVASVAEARRRFGIRLPA